MGHTGSFIDVRHPMGTVGLLLMVVVARLAEPALATHTTTATRARGFTARRAIDAIALVGWFFDRLPAARRGAHLDRAEFQAHAEAAGATTAVIRR